MLRVMVLILLLFAALVPPAYAAERALAVYPSREELVVRPGEVQAFSVTVANPGEVALHVHAYLADWTLMPDGTLVFLPAGRSAHTAVDWIHFSPSRFVLAPNQSQTVRVSVSVPAGIPGGEGQSMLFFESQPTAATHQAGGATLLISQRVGNTIYVAVPPYARKATVTAMAYLPPKGRTPARLGLVLADLGTVHVRFTGKLKVRDASGKLVANHTITDLPVLRESKRMVFVPLAHALPPGVYRAHLTLDYGADRMIDARGQLRASP